MLTLVRFRVHIREATEYKSPVRYCLLNYEYDFSMYKQDNNHLISPETSYYLFAWHYFNAVSYWEKMTKQ